MKIAFFEVEEWEKPLLSEKLHGDDLVFYPDPLTIENVAIAKDFEMISVFVCSTINKEVIDQLPHLKFVTTRSTGFDHIDTAYCKERHIVACNVPHYGTHTVAEHTFALILALSRKLFVSIDGTKRGEFDHSNLLGFDLYGKVLGIFGLGDIGISVARIAKGFGMNVVAYSRHPSEALARELGISFLEFNEVLSLSDIITLHVPYSKETEHMINKKNIKKFKKGSLLINTARGGLVETESLLFGLEKGILGGAGLDVLEEENLIKEERQLIGRHGVKSADLRTLYYDHILMKLDNVVITPHNAFNSKEALELILDVTVQNILAFEDKKMQNTV